MLKKDLLVPTITYVLAKDPFFSEHTVCVGGDINLTQSIFFLVSDAASSDNQDHDQDFSHPGQIIWSYKVRDYWDYDDDDDDDDDDEKAREEKEEHEEAKGRWLDNGVLEDTCPSLDGNLWSQCMQGQNPS